QTFQSLEPLVERRALGDSYLGGGVLVDDAVDRVPVRHIHDRKQRLALFKARQQPVRCGYGELYASGNERIDVWTVAGRRSDLDVETFLRKQPLVDCDEQRQKIHADDGDCDPELLQRLSSAVGNRFEAHHGGYQQDLPNLSQHYVPRLRTSTQSRSWRPICRDRI